MHDTWFERVEDDDELGIIEELDKLLDKINRTTDVDDLAELYERLELLDKLIKK